MFNVQFIILGHDCSSIEQRFMRHIERTRLVSMTCSKIEDISINILVSICDRNSLQDLLYSWRRFVEIIT